MTASLRIAITLLLVSQSLPVCAQAVSYHHRSTAQGDYLSGAADYEAATGRATLHRAQAFEQQISAQERLMQLEYNYYQLRQQVAHDQLQLRERRSDIARKRQQDEEAKSQAAALTMLSRIQLGLHVWPRALRRDEYAASISTIEGILKSWTQAASTDSVFAARALLTEAALLETKVAANLRASHGDRVHAVRTLRLLQRLPELHYANGSASTVLAAAR